MKKTSLFFAFAITGLGFASLSQASYVANYKFTKDKEEVKVRALGTDLAAFLRAVGKCPVKEQAKLDFGNQVKEFARTNDRNLPDSFVIVSQGNRPAPSFAGYSSKTSIKVTREAEGPGPQAPDKPPVFKYDCKTEITEVPVEKN